MDFEEVKSNSEALIKGYGGEICDWLPIYEITEMR